MDETADAPRAQRASPSGAPDATEASRVTIPRSIPVRRGAGGDDGDGGLGHLRVVIGVLMAGLVCTVALVRRRRVGRSGGAASGSGWLELLARRRPGGVQVAQSVRLTPGASLHVVQWDGHELLIGCVNGGGVSLLRTRALPDEPAPGDASAADVGASRGAAP